MSARTALRRITAGTATIIRGLGWAGEWRETLARWFIAALAASLATAAVAVHPWLAPVAIIGWAAAAGAAAADAEQPDEDAPDDEDDAPDDEQQLLDAETFAEIVHATARGANVHLTAIGRQLLAETGHDWDVLTLCRTHGITTKPVRVAGADPAVTTGIHRLDLPPLPRAAAAPGGVVVAGHADNNNTEQYPDSVVLIPDMMHKARR